MKKGLFITFEGPDGSGKTTQIQLLKAYLEEKGYQATLSREPGGTAIGEKIRTIILDKENQEMDAMAEALLYAACRAQHVSQVILPALMQGITVICDRFVDSSIAYQGYGRGLGASVEQINEIAVNGCEPDGTFLLALDPETGKNRIQVDQHDRLESEKLEYHKEVYRGYMELAKQNPTRIFVVDADRTREQVHQVIRQQIDRLLDL